jgi:transposase
MAITTMAHPTPPRVTVGVDTHKDTHVAAARDQLGRRLGTTQVPASSAGYAQLLAWAHALGEVAAWGVEGTGSYGAGLARFLAGHGQRVVEVNRPDRQARRRRGKSDAVDADAAARAVQAGEATGVPKAQDGVVEMLRALRAARQTAVKARTQAINALKGLLVTAPAELREQLGGLPTGRLVGAAAELEVGTLTTPTAAVRLALRGLGQRYQHLDAEIALLTEQLDALTAGHAPKLRDLHGVGPDGAAALLIAAGDNPRRLHSEAAFAALCGTSPGGGLLGQDPPAPSEPGWGPPGQRRAAPRRGRAAALAPTHPRLRHQAHHAGQDQQRNPSLPQALRGPRSLRRAPPDRRPRPSRCRLTCT